MGIKTKTFLFLGISLFFILGVFGVSQAGCSAGNYDYNSCYYNGNYNYGGCSGTSCYNPANYEGACATCSSNYNTNYNYSSNSCENFGPNYCYGGNVYHQRNCYRTDNNGVRTNYVDNQIVQFCVAGQSCQNGQCAVACDCSGGPCCDGCHFKSATTSCNSETQNEYGCPWGSICGSDVGIRTKTKYQYCTGNSNQCTGNWGDWLAPSAWQVSAACSTGQTCAVGNSACQTSSSCARPMPSYLEHYRKTCSDGNSYWFDSNGSKQEVYQICNDQNECTVDSCPGSQCVNELKCDGTTCAIGSQNYCGKCSRCGDGACSCGETSDTCLADCKTLNGLPFSLFENTGSNSQWVKNASIKAGEKINFLAIISSNEKDVVNNVVVRVSVPDELSIGSIKIDGEPLSGNIRTGINIGTLAPKESRAIAFSGQTAKTLTQKSGDITSTITAENIPSASSDSVKFAFAESNLAASPAAGAGLTASLSGMFRNKYFLPILIAIIVGLFIIRMIYLSFFRK